MTEKRERIKALLLIIDSATIMLINAEKELEEIAENVTPEEEAILENDEELKAIAERINKLDY